ncbi:Succinate dehydrogenase iron-sulfur subunit [Gammaproteobacteria bacterium]
MFRKKENIDIDDLLFVVKILRFDSRNEQSPHFAHYRIIAKRGMTVLDALLKIQEEQDATLVFRYSCRGAVCGSCGMVINGQPNLACRVQLCHLPTREIVLEPLPNLPIIKDLIVDMEPFWAAYRSIEPWLQVDEGKKKDEYFVDKTTMAKFEQYANCVLCACCHGSCPVVARDDKYLGPAALLKLYRFLQDPRDHRDARVALERVNNSQGVWGCDTVFRCVDSCPKEIRPTDGITGLRRQLFLSKFMNCHK